ncbi:hypothetical protein ADUPG1_009198, partial [Aduncisulcus paluster]
MATEVARRTNQNCYLLLCDIKGAFDNLHLDTVADGLEALPVSRELKQRVYSNVADRYLATAEDLFIPARGVPQGNPLSPLEFSYGINDPLKEAGKLA